MKRTALCPAHSGHTTTIIALSPFDKALLSCWRHSLQVLPSQERISSGHFQSSTAKFLETEKLRSPLVLGLVNQSGQRWNQKSGWSASRACVLKHWATCFCYMDRKQKPKHGMNRSLVGQKRKGNTGRKLTKKKSVRESVGE